MVSAKCVCYMLARGDDTNSRSTDIAHPFVPNMNFSSLLSLTKLRQRRTAIPSNAQTVLMQAISTLKQHGRSATGRAYIDRAVFYEIMAITAPHIIRPRRAQRYSPETRTRSPCSAKSPHFDSGSQFEPYTHKITSCR
jgi:hypothetical protein